MTKKTPEYFRTLWTERFENETKRFGNQTKRFENGTLLRCSCALQGLYQYLHIIIMLDGTMY